MEGRRSTKENIGQTTAPRTQSRISELSDLLGVRKVDVRFDARYLRSEPYAAILHVRICAGGVGSTGVPTATKCSSSFDKAQDERRMD